MQPADVIANQALTLLVSAGGSWGIGLSSTMPELVSGAYSNVTDVTEVTHGSIARSGGSWGTASGRSIIPAADIDLGDTSGDCAPVAWVLYNSTTPVWCGRLVGLPSSIVTGTHVVLPKETVRLIVP